MIVLESPSKLMAAQLASCSLEDPTTEDSTAHEPQRTKISVNEKEGKGVAKKSPLKRDRPNTRSQNKTKASESEESKPTECSSSTKQDDLMKVIKQFPEIENSVRVSPQKKSKDEHDNFSTVNKTNSMASKKQLHFDETLEQLSPQTVIESIGSNDNSAVNVEKICQNEEIKPGNPEILLGETKLSEVKIIDSSFVPSNSNLHGADSGQQETASSSHEKVPGDSLHGHLNKKLANKPRRSQSVEVTPIKPSKGKQGDKNSKKVAGGKSKKLSKRATSQENLKDSNFKVTDFYEYRRSYRRLYTKQPTKEELYERCVLEQCKDGLKIENFPGKGRGIVATKTFERNDFVVEYRGDLILPSEAKDREVKFESDPEVGCYMYYFVLGNTRYCIDATKELESFGYGRLLNHSRKHPNCRTKAIWVKGEPKLILIANRTINEGEELLYDYGDRSKTAIENHPWLAQ
ncbi:N-lysine methyltransferase KMT5A-B-like [Symsagittifera roscoffensis]|uniref:N-lysine methyltransferase KMT5A-B-like n=1 Tax=Symsagittifera roscoffensis TaxID=84072 RepID=UPI00307C6666